jgi:GNAT superfamily N-acetyltransferase
VRQRQQKLGPGLFRPYQHTGDIGINGPKPILLADDETRNSLNALDTIPAETTDCATGYRRLPAGKLANAVTWMECRIPQPDLARPLTMIRITQPDIPSYRAIFLRIGSPWLWDRVCEMSDAEIADHFADPHQHIYYGHDETGTHVGMVEFAPIDGGIEITYFGLFPDLTGRGLGKRLMAGTLELAWRLRPSRIWLHTSSFDHPTVIPFYQSCGFVAVASGFEIIDDPRLKGSLPRTAAPHIPLIETEWSPVDSRSGTGFAQTAATGKPRGAR